MMVNWNILGVWTVGPDQVRHLRTLGNYCLTFIEQKINWCNDNNSEALETI